MNLPRAVAKSAPARCRAFLQSFAFEALFDVPPIHRLVPVRSRSRGGINHGVYWEHEEYDDSDRLVARYECFDETNNVGEHRIGWFKYDRVGNVIEEVMWKPQVPL